MTLNQTYKSRMFPCKQRTKKPRKSLPCARDISPTDAVSGDERSALEHFLGRDVAEILQLMQEGHFESLQEDLMFMGKRGFEYYLEAVWLYVQEWTDEDFGWYGGYLISFMESRMQTEGATELGIRHYAMSAAELAAHPHARALRTHCITQLERVLAAGGTEWLEPTELQEQLKRWRSLF